MVVARWGHFDCVCQGGLAGYEADEQDAGQGEQEKQSRSVLVDDANHSGFIIIISHPLALTNATSRM